MTARASVLAGMILFVVVVTVYYVMAEHHIDQAPLMLFAGPIVTYLLVGAKVTASSETITTGQSANQTAITGTVIDTTAELTRTMLDTKHELTGTVLDTKHELTGTVLDSTAELAGTVQAAAHPEGTPTP